MFSSSSSLLFFRAYAIEYLHAARSLASHVIFWYLCGAAAAALRSSDFSARSVRRTLPRWRHEVLKKVGIGPETSPPQDWTFHGQMAKEDAVSVGTANYECQTLPWARLPRKVQARRWVMYCDRCCAGYLGTWRWFGCMGVPAAEVL